MDPFYVSGYDVFIITIIVIVLAHILQSAYFFRIANQMVETLSNMVRIS